MSDVTLELLNKRTAVAALRQEATRIGVDSELLLDSKRLHDQLAALDPDEPGFTGRVREIAGEAAGRLGGRPTASPQPDRQQAPRQWTMADVDALPNTRAGGEALTEAIEAGLLVDLGYPPAKGRR